MQPKKTVLIISLLALVISILAAIVVFKTNKKIGFVLINDVFNEFELKKEMVSKYNVTRDARKKILDSLQIDLSVLSNRINNKLTKEGDTELFERKKLEYGHKMKLFDEDNMQITKQFDEQIIKQLNQYVSDFGKDNHYDIIYGNTVDGSIMFGTEELNITEKVISYVNEKYKGVK